MQRVEALDRARTWTLSPYVSLLLIVIGAGVLRWLFLGTKSLDLDEAFSIMLARQDWGSFFQSLSTREGHMTLYFVLLRVWRGLGESEATVRTLSVLSAVATVPMLYALGARLFDARVALIAALLLSFNAFHVQYAQEARSYSLVMLLATCSSYFLVRSLDEPSRKSWWAAYIITSVLAVYSHLFGILVLLSQWASVVFLRRRDIPLRALVTSIVLIGAALLPLAIFVLARTTAPAGWAAPRPRLSSVLGVFYVLAGNTGRLAHPDPAGLALMVAYLALCLRAVLPGAGTPGGAQSFIGPWRSRLLLTWLCLPVVLAFGIALAKPTTAPFWAFYLIICLPPYVLLTAAGLASIRPTPVLACVLVATVGLGAYEVDRYYRVFQKEDFRDATYRLLSLAAPGDAVVFDAPYGRDGFEYYRDRAPGAPSVVVVPTWQDAAAGYRRVWLFINSGVDTHATEAGLAKKYAPAREWTFPGIRLVLYERAGVSGSGAQPSGRGTEIIRTIPPAHQARSFERRGHFPRPGATRPLFRKVG